MKSVLRTWAAVLLFIGISISSLVTIVAPVVIGTLLWGAWGLVPGMFGTLLLFTLALAISIEMSDEF